MPSNRSLPRPTILDGLSRSDDLLVENVKILRSVEALLSREEKRETRSVYFTYPDNGLLATLQVGTTVLNFMTGTVEDVDHNFTNMGHSLQSEGRDWLRSFFVTSDKSIVVQPDSYDKIPATEEKDAIGIYQEFTKLTITCTEETKVFVACCTSPEAVVRLISNTVVFADPIDPWGQRVLIGAGELAARLGSIVRYHKSGEVIFMEDFEDATLNKWGKFESGETGDSEYLTIDRSLSGNYSAKLTTAAGVDHMSGIYRYFHIPPSKNIGLEVSFTEQATCGAFYLHLQFSQTDINRVTRPQIRYYITTETLKYLDSDNVLQTLATDVIIESTSEERCFNTMKLIVDLDNKEYKKLLLNENTYDMSGIKIRSMAGTSHPVAMLEIGNISDPTTAYGIMYVDNIIVTQNEPIT